MSNQQINVKTRCPECKTEYPLVPAALEAARGMARCGNCKHIFNAYDNRVSRPGGSEAVHTPAKPLAHNIPAPFQAHSDNPAMPPPMIAEDYGRRPFAESKSTARLWQVPLVLLLGILLIAQILWMYRATLLGLPLAQPLCAWIDCSIAEKRAPESFRVVEREIRHDPFQQDVLHFKLRFRNDAAFAQPLPELLLHLFDSNEYLVARRRLHPHEYLPGSATAGVKVQPREIINIELAFMDPGAHASGFKIEFF